MVETTKKAGKRAKNRKSLAVNTSAGANEGNSVRVYCRIRPHNAIEQSRGGRPCVLSTTETSVEVDVNDTPYTFSYDQVFNESKGQEDVFNGLAKPVVDDVMSGYNCTIFAYGQTSSGKTYTMEGASLTDANLAGIIPRTAQELFSNVMSADENIEFVVKISYIEIYMEKIRDLLDPYRTKANLQVRRDQHKGIYVAGATEISVTSEKELLSVMEGGKENRAVAATGMNEGSSRSHSVFMITVSQRNIETQAMKIGKIFLVDLAGSEMVRKTGASGQQLEEAKTINKSLSALGQVITALTENSKHVPYRDSKLTRVLEDSIGGNSRTALIINISPSSYNAAETLSTLRFGSRAKKIKNVAIVNEERSVEELKALLRKSEEALALKESYIASLEARVAEDSSLSSSKFDQTVVETLTLNEENTGQENGDDSQCEAPFSTLDGVSLQVLNHSMSPCSPRLAAAQAIETLQRKLEEREQELQEEREENERVSKEMWSYKELLNEKHAAIERLESDLRGQFEKEMSAKMEEYETKDIEIREQVDTLRQALEQAEYAKEELKLHSEKLEEQKQKLVEEMNGLEDISAEAQKNTVNDVESDSQLKIQAYHEEKRHLLNDLDEKQSKIHALQAEVDRLQRSSMSSPTSTVSSSIMSDPGFPMDDLQSSASSSSLSHKQRQHTRSVQQRLEQLTAIHRQVLRKYVSLELELNEAKKILLHRDDRIKQLEANTQLLTGNMRAQADRHMKEVRALKADAARAHHAQVAPAGPGAFDPRKTEGVIRPIRGGGGRSSRNLHMGKQGARPAISNDTSGHAASPGESNPNSSFFSRFFSNSKPGKYVKSKLDA